MYGFQRREFLLPSHEGGSTTAPREFKGYDTQMHPENLTEQSFYWRDLHANTFMSLSCKFVTSQSFCRSFDLEEGPVRVPKKARFLSRANTSLIAIICVSSLTQSAVPVPTDPRAGDGCENQWHTCPTPVILQGPELIYTLSQVGVALWTPSSLQSAPGRAQSERARRRGVMVIPTG